MLNNPLKRLNIINTVVIDGVTKSVANLSATGTAYTATTSSAEYLNINGPNAVSSNINPVGVIDGVSYTFSDSLISLEGNIDSIAVGGFGGELTEICVDTCSSQQPVASNCEEFGGYPFTDTTLTFTPDASGATPISSDLGVTPTWNDSELTITPNYAGATGVSADLGLEYAWGGTGLTDTTLTIQNKVGGAAISQELGTSAE